MLLSGRMWCKHSMFLALILVAVKGTVDLKKGGIGHTYY